MTDLPFGGCDHPGLMLSWGQHTYQNPDQSGPHLYSVHISVHCPHCNARFQFLGENPLAPVSVVEAQRERIGAWVSNDLAELGCMIAPIEQGGGLADLAVKGRA